jgi:hypothetical protein
MARHDKRKRGPTSDVDGVVEQSVREPAKCWLRARRLGETIEYHHPLPKSRGGRVKVAVHSICHKTIHAAWTNTELARIGDAPQALAAHPDVAKFLAWIADKPADFHAPTAKKRKV